MSKCGYYSCFKGKPTCKHPTYGEQYTEAGDIAWRCTSCHRQCGGIYPSEMPRVDTSDWVVDVVDKNGNKLN